MCFDKMKGYKAQQGHLGLFFFLFCKEIETYKRNNTQEERKRERYEAESTTAFDTLVTVLCFFNKFSSRIVALSSFLVVWRGGR